mmetsp:Transcript_36998/g.98569  ORF Transcript_36998/g.98569 Transcript_36998/m.98569 type:complete len:206 (+) Transcript_36998:99-716(+)
MLVGVAIQVQHHVRAFHVILQAKCHEASRKWQNKERHHHRFLHVGAKKSEKVFNGLVEQWISLVCDVAGNHVLAQILCGTEPKILVQYHFGSDAMPPECVHCAEVRLLRQDVVSWIELLDPTEAEVVPKEASVLKKVPPSLVVVDGPPTLHGKVRVARLGVGRFVLLVAGAEYFTDPVNFRLSFAPEHDFWRVTRQQKAPSPLIW